jgi:hypothetical protein
MPKLIAVSDTLAQRLPSVRHEGAGYQYPIEP